VIYLQLNIYKYIILILPVHAAMLFSSKSQAGCETNVFFLEEQPPKHGFCTCIQHMHWRLVWVEKNQVHFLGSVITVNG
jgi:hypothetical protein